MSVASILAKCGMSAEDVQKLAQKHMTKVQTRTLSVAEQNELKYEGVETAEDRWEKTHGSVYRAIQAGTDNGNCSTRRSTYRKLKTGDGRCATMESLRIRRELDSRLKHDERGKFAGYS